MNRIMNLVAIGIFSILVLGIPAIASAQYRDRDDDRYDNNGKYGQYGNNGYGDMRSTIRGLKNRARELQRHLDNDLDNSRYNGTRREDEINRIAKDFRNAVNRLSESNNNNGNYGRRDEKVDRVLSLGSQLDRAFSRTRVDYHVEEIWSEIRNDLRVLGNGYGGYNNNRYPNGNNNGYPNGSNNRRNLPSWWPF